MCGEMRICLDQFEYRLVFRVGSIRVNRDIQCRFLFTMPLKKVE